MISLSSRRQDKGVRNLEFLTPLSLPLHIPKATLGISAPKRQGREYFFSLGVTNTIQQGKWGSIYSWLSTIQHGQDIPLQHPSLPIHFHFFVSFNPKHAWQPTQRPLTQSRLGYLTLLQRSAMLILNPALWLRTLGVTHYSVSFLGEETFPVPTIILSRLRELCFAKSNMKGKERCGYLA